MKIIIFIIILIIIFIILYNIDKNINDNFINYQMSKMGENTKDIKIHGRNINIETNNSTFNVNKLCIDDECLNIKNEETLPREQGPQGVCTDNDCYYCTCNNGQPADIIAGLNSCKKKKSDGDTEQCKSCKLGYQLNSEKKCVQCSTNTYNDNKFNTGLCNTCASCPVGQYRKNCGATLSGKCEVCQGCPAGQRRINCGGKKPGTCSQNTCVCSNGTAATGSACTSNGENICKSCNSGFYKDGIKCNACAGCGSSPAIGRVYRNDGHFASYHGPNAIPASLFVRDGCYGTNPGSCKLKDNVTFLCGTNVKCNQVGFSMCANSDGSGKWAKDWHWGTGYHSSYGNRQIFTSHVCGRWPSPNQINNPNRNDGSANANVLVFDTTYKW